MSDPYSPARCRERVMDALARREHAFDELFQKLCERGFDPDTVTEQLVRLRDEGLQSDARFAEAFVSSRFRQGKGPQRIRAELRGRGLGDSEIAEAFAAASHDWFKLAAEVRERKFGVVAPTEFSEKARQMRFLSYRGFSQEHISVAMSGARPVE
ncbi:MAG: regulatory protein RecX [Pseudomonadota bacterium]